MKRVIQFTKFRYLMILSLLIIIAGIAGTVVQGGFNLGIDFNAGLNQRVQIAPVAMKVSYSGEDSVLFNVTSSGLILEVRDADGLDRTEISYGDYPVLRAVAAALNGVEGVQAELMVSGQISSSDLLSLNFAIDLSQESAVVNMVPAGDESSIEEIRSLLDGIGSTMIQIVGSPQDQEYLIRVKDPGNTDNFSETMASEIRSRLSSEYGAEQVIVKQTDYVGPRFSQDLGRQSFTLTLIALTLILVYIWFRFQLAYAVSAIVALIHDVAFMLGIIGTFQLEVSTATIAAVLTIIGYSLNDTIVIFDRIRENRDLMKDSRLPEVINTSITQSLSRTLITSITTLLAVLAIYIFATGSIQLFALNLIIGILVGTYSSIFIASPVLLTWSSVANKRRQSRDEAKYGSTKKEALPREASPEEQKAQTPQTAIPTVERKKRGGKRKKK
ncbi:protein translocase subunit SecF [Marispirochaeta aestuarii]|uniref:protein translocase subunit SecF n=1 Tax=Marispirochaeta aestuarii TaxID=1963862 RepID=UPI0029C838A5|nr:protein translocase subunit SecF [Marispirochaeta aestuarii]